MITAPIHKRFLSAFIDFWAISWIITALMWLSGQLVGVILFRVAKIIFKQNIPSQDFSGYFSSIYILIILITPVIYFMVFWHSNSASTLGQKILNLKIKEHLKGRKETKLFLRSLINGLLAGPILYTCLAFIINIPQIIPSAQGTVILSVAVILFIPHIKIIGTSLIDRATGTRIIEVRK